MASSTPESATLSPEATNATSPDGRRSKYDSISTSFVEFDETDKGQTPSPNQAPSKPESFQQIMHSFFVQPMIESAMVGNWSGYWVLGFLTSFAFFFPTNPVFVEARERQPFGPWFLVHLTCAGAISFICLFNIFHTPSQGPKYCVFHRWLGRVGIIVSVVAALTGIIVAWWERYTPGLIGQSIALSFLAVMQIFVTVKGYIVIRTAKQYPSSKESGVAVSAESVAPLDSAEERKKWIEKHRYWMLFLWVCCLGPAWFRVPGVFFGASPNSNWMFIALIPTNFWIPLYLRALEKKSFW